MPSFSGILCCCWFICRKRQTAFTFPQNTASLHAPCLTPLPSSSSASQGDTFYDHSCKCTISPATSALTQGPQYNSSSPSSILLLNIPRHSYVSTPPDSFIHEFISPGYLHILFRILIQKSFIHCWGYCYGIGLYIGSGYCFLWLFILNLC